MKASRHRIAIRFISMRSATAEAEWQWLQAQECCETIWPKDRRTRSWICAAEAFTRGFHHHQLHNHDAAAFGSSSTTMPTGMKLVNAFSDGEFAGFVPPRYLHDRRHEADSVQPPVSRGHRPCRCG